MPDGGKGSMRPEEMREVLGRKGLVAPRILTLSITGTCNLFCRHCWVEAGPDGSVPALSGETIDRLLSEFAFLGGEGVRFTGGEPLCHPALPGRMALARRLGLSPVVLQTNGTLLVDEAVSALAALDFPGLVIQISLDGARAATHDRVRGEGAFELAMEGIHRLVAAGLASRVVLAFTEMQHNLEEFPLLLELAESLGICSVVAGTLVTGGRAAADHSGPVAAATPAQYLLLVDRFETDLRFRQLYRKLGNLAALEWWEGKSAGRNCCRFVEQPYLTPAGLLYPCLLCHSASFAVSGVLDKALTDAFAEGAPLWATLQDVCRSREATLAACQTCLERSDCAAGCPGRALGSHGSLLATDDRCALRQAIGRRRRSDPGNP